MLLTLSVKLSVNTAKTSDTRRSQVTQTSQGSSYYYSSQGRWNTHLSDVIFLLALFGGLNQQTLGIIAGITILAVTGYIDDRFEEIFTLF